MRVLENYFSDLKFLDIYHFLARSKKYFKFPWFGYFLWWAQNRCHCRKQLHCEQRGLRFVSLESAVSIMVICPFLGQGPFCLLMLSLGNKGQWVALERGQMAGLFPVSRWPPPPPPRRLAPGCPGAWPPGRLLDDLLTPTSQRRACICALPFQSGKECEYFQWLCISSEEKLYSLNKMLPSWCVYLFIQTKWPRLFCKFSEANVNANQIHL